MLTVIESVTGPVSTDALGVTMPHEHTFVDTMREYRGDGLVYDPELLRDELQLFRSAGGRTIVDCTTRGLRPDPVGARRLSRETGVTIIMGTGFYRDPFIDETWFDQHSTDEVADLLIRDIAIGIDDTGVRAGIIGEIGCDRFLTPAEERSFRAAARAHLATDVTITTHAARWPVGLPQLDLLESEGVRPGRVIIGHCDLVPNTAYHLELAERGAYVQFDNIQASTPFRVQQTIHAIRMLLKAGHGDRILLSQDICLVSQFSAMGGSGYGYILTHFAADMAAAGIAPADIDRLLVDNPARALGGLT